MSKQLILSVLVSAEGTDFTTTGTKKPKLKSFNASQIKTVDPLTATPAGSLGSIITVIDPNKAVHSTVKVAEGPAQVSTAYDISTTTNMDADVSANLTAFAGGGQASATALTNYLNNVTVVATANDSVKLPLAAGAIRVLIVRNTGVATAAVFPQTGEKIDAAAVNASVLAPKGLTRFWSNGTQWYTVTY